MANNTTTTNTIKVVRKDIRLPSPTPRFERVRPFIDPPLEISRAQLAGLNMVDETIIIRSSLKRNKGEL